MSKLLKSLLFSFLLFSSNQAMAEVILVMTHDVKGDTAGCIELNKQYNELALKLIPKNHPNVRMVQASYAGPDSGVLWLVVEFDDMADLARATSILDASKDATALSEKINKACPIVSTSIGTQLYYHPGTK